MFLKAIIVLLSFAVHMAKTKQFLLLISAFVGKKKKAKAAMLIEVRREKTKSSQDLPERFGVKKRAAILWTCGGEKNKIRAVGGDLPGSSICQRSVRFVD